jgi:hydroxyacylglutathione hydrolase
MALVIQQIHTPGIAQLSYLVGDDSAGVAAVIDPRPDVEVYLQIAREHSLAITHIIETHVHADFLSGALELQGRLGRAKVCTSREAGAQYGFESEPLSDGSRIGLGEVLLTAKHTPGHTPEHVSLLAAERGPPGEPWAVLSGDSLFAGSAGRPDLVGGPDETRELAGSLFDTLCGFYSRLPDGVIVYPGHAAGSACGPDIGDRMVTTIGFERRHNPFFQIREREAFIRHTLETRVPEPRHYRPMKALNREGPPVFGCLPPVQALPPARLRSALSEGRPVLLDTRDILAFGGGHIQGALNIGARPELSPWAGWMIRFEDPVLLVLPSDEDLERVVRYLWRVGVTRLAGYLAGGMEAWSRAGFELARISQLTVRELREAAETLQIVDVRTPAEWERGHIPGAQHMFVPDLSGGLDALDRFKPVAVYCASGYRASIAASVLRKEGFEQVCNVPGGIQAWENAGFPLVCD